LDNLDSERVFTFDRADPRDLFAAGSEIFSQLKRGFPRLKLVARGDEMKTIGPQTDIDHFGAKWDLLTWHLERYGRLTEDELEQLLRKPGETIRLRVEKEDVLLYGPHGDPIRARTKGQQELVDAALRNDLVFAIGPAGSGKSYTAVALAVQALKEKRVKRIVLTRPAVEAGENLGFLPGDLKEKLDPYMQPLYDALTDMLGYEKVADHLEKGVIEIAPLAFMRGRTLDHAFVILDEAQNATTAQMKMFLTRMGRRAKFIVTGDATQVDLPGRQPSGLRVIQDVLKGVKDISFVHLTADDVIRHVIVKRVIAAFEKSEQNEPIHPTPRPRTP
jgi:phosphate starvation-inducible PhoH-like protein